MKQENGKKSLRYAIISLLVYVLAVPNLYAQDDLNDLIVQRKNIQKQVDAMAKNDKTFKTKGSYADFLSTYKKLTDLDEQIILASNFSVNTLVRERDEALRKANTSPKTIIKTVPGKAVVIPGSNDSLANALTSLQFQTSNLSSVLKSKDDALMRLATKADSLETSNRKLAARFNDIETDNKGLNEKNLVLLIFNSLVVIALIMSLFFLFRKPMAKKLLFNDPAPHPASPMAAAAPAEVQYIIPTTVATPIAETPPPAPVNPVPPPVPSPPIPEPERIIKRPEVTRPEPVFKVSSEGILAGTHDGLDLKLDQIEKLARLKEKGYLTEEEFNTQKKQILGS